MKAADLNTALTRVLPLSLLLLLGACASAPPMPPATDLFHDAAFAAPAQQRIDPAAALAISPAMRAYLAANFGQRTRNVDRRRQLINALYRGDLKLEYDAESTRTAAEAFDARSGNCLALVLMTAAFAKEVGLTVRYQQVVGTEAWSRADQLYIGIGHVNLRLDDPSLRSSSPLSDANSMVVDFLPSVDARTLNTTLIDERTVIAMYLNNRAVEMLTGGQVDAAYWWAREAIRTDPQMLGAYVTLGVIYRRHGEPAWAEAALARVAEREPNNIYAMSNRVLALRDLGRDADSAALAKRLEALDPQPPFKYFNEGLAAYRAGRIDVARRLFAKEVARAPYHHEFEYWLAVTYVELNDVERATIHLRRAAEVSTTRKDHDLYAGKLERLKALTTH
jgi:tetratricopeptide (TPR) repeat protein